MIWFLIIVAVVVLIALWYRRGQSSEKGDNEPVDTFVCDQCGKQECICHKEETE